MMLPVRSMATRVALPLTSVRTFSTNISKADIEQGTTNNIREVKTYDGVEQIEVVSPDNIIAKIIANRGKCV